MKITVAKPDLENALQVASISMSSSGDDISTHFLFRYRNNGVEVLTFNKRVCALVPLKCKVDDTGDADGTLNVEGWRLLQWLGGIGDVPVTIEADGPAVVKLSSPRSKVRLRSKDASNFPYWDKTLGDGVVKATIDGGRLASALDYAKNFVYKQDTTLPAFSQVEVMRGALWASDKRSILKVSLSDLANSNLRIHGNDIPAATKFLSLSDTGTVEIIEHDRSAFLKRGDGAIFGVTRPQIAFPELKGADADYPDGTEWQVLTADLLSGFQCLKASADKENEKIRFTYDADQKAVVLGVSASAGGEDVYPVEAAGVSGADNLPAGGFKLSFPHLQRVIGQFKGDSLRFSNHKNPKDPKGKGGISRFLHKVENDEYLTILTWRDS